MRDQAAGLRRVPAQLDSRTDPGAAGAPVFVVGSGKGGVGKSVLAVVLAAALRRQGLRVLLFDGCQELGNLHILLGVRRPVVLEAFRSGEGTAEDLLLSIGDDLCLLSVDSGGDAVRSMTPTDRARLHFRLTTLFDRFDAVVLDAGSGFESTLRATMGATRLLAVAVPEPASLCDAYALIKLVTIEAAQLPVGVIVNRVISEQEAQAAYERLRLGAERFLKREITYVGAVAENEALRHAVCRPGELLSCAPADVVAIARWMAAECKEHNAARAGHGQARAGSGASASTAAGPAGTGGTV